MIHNAAEQLVFDSYIRRYGHLGFEIPAIIPQVYLHYDPYTIRARGGSSSSPLVRQRMDFLLLFSDRQRVILEFDGQQRYADSNGKANGFIYAEMMAEDRRLRLAGYESTGLGPKNYLAKTRKRCSTRSSTIFIKGCARDGIR